MATNLSGAHDPDKTTVGIPGQTYTNTVTGEEWKCLAIYNTKAQGLNKTEYFWARVSESGSSAADTITYLENLDSNNRIPLRSLDSGMYILHGYFTSYAGAPNSYTFSQGMLVSIGKATNQSYVQIFYSKDNTIQYLVITDDSVERKDAKLVNMESIANKVTEIDNSADHYHYPSAKGVYDALSKCGTAAPTAQTEGKVGMAYYVVADNKVTEMYVCVESTIAARTWAKIELGTTQGG